MPKYRNCSRASTVMSSINAMVHLSSAPGGLPAAMVSQRAPWRQRRICVGVTNDLPSGGYNRNIAPAPGECRSVRGGANVEQTGGDQSMFKFKNRCLNFRLTVVFGLSIGLIRAAAANALTTENLLVNGDAELQQCTNDWTAQSSIPGWRVIRGAASG